MKLSVADKIHLSQDSCVLIFAITIEQISVCTVIDISLIGLWLHKDWTYMLLVNFNHA